MSGKPATNTTTPAPELDMSMLTWSAAYVPPGTPYDDEESVDRPTGWWVRGHWLGGGSDEPAGVDIHIDHAFDEDGFDIREATAKRIAAALEAAADADRLTPPPSAEPDGILARLRQFIERR